MISHKDTTTLRSTAVLAGGYVIVSLLFNLLFCPCTSPLWNRLIGDQAMFSIIGENWANGLLPYVNTWDSKGPLIFFFNMLGHKIASGENGIFILQVLNLAGVLLISHLYMRRWCRLGHELLFQLLFVMNYVIICSFGGNQVGDSTQLLGTWAVMCAYDWTRGLEQRRYAHPWGYAVVYGMFTAGCLLSRLTNGLVILTIAGIAAVILMRHGLWRNLMAYNIKATYYSYSHRRPCYRFFCVQDWAIQNSSSLRPKVRACFQSGKAKWVLVTQYKTSAIKEILDKDYTVCRRDAASDLILFKRKTK